MYISFHYVYSAGNLDALLDILLSRRSLIPLILLYAELIVIEIYVHM